MKIKQIIIQNYRQFLQESICMEEKITFLAGANNSGKTSIIELLNCILGGHDKVFFIAEDNSHLGVDIYSFFKMKTEIDVEFQSFQKFYYEYQKEVENLKKMVSKDFLKSAEVYKEVLDEVRNHTKEINEKFINNMYYQYLYKEFYDKSLNPKPTHKNIKEYVNINKAKKILLAYKLFYVGCSRAKTKLYVFVSKDKIKNFRNEFINAFQKIGFEIWEEGNCNG